MIGKTRFHKAALLSAFILFGVTLPGCSFLPPLAASSAINGGAGSGEYLETPVINSALYSNDYTVDEGPVKGGSVNIYATEPDTFNPLLTRNIYTAAIMGLVYDSLIGIGPDLAVESRLAERWTPSADGLIWHIVLREGITWHDGRPLRAYDVVDTIERIRSYGGQSPYADAVANILSATAMSELEIRLMLVKENAFTPYTWIFPIVPSHVMIDALDGQGGGANLRAALIGAGPYRFKNYENNTKLSLTADDTWWGAAEKNVAAGSASPDTDAGAGVSSPFIDDVAFIFYDPAVTAISRFRTNDVDLFFSRTLNYTRYKSSSELKIKQFSEREFLFVAFNCSGGVTSARSVRRALLRMVDRQALIDEALDGRGIAAEFPVRPENLLYGSGIVNTPYDIQAARSILESAGYRMDNGRFYGDSGNGWRNLSLTMLVNESDADRCALADSLAEAFSACGVELIVSREPADSIAEKLAAGEFEAALLEYVTPLYPDMTELYSTPWLGAMERANPARYENEEADRLSHEMFKLYNDLDRQTAFTELAAIIQDDAPYIGLCFKAAALVHDENLRGGIYPDAGSPLNNFENWYIADYK